MKPLTPLQEEIRRLMEKEILDWLSDGEAYSRVAAMLNMDILTFRPLLYDIRIKTGLLGVKRDRYLQKLRKPKIEQP